jgi:hypothetical protein
MISQIETGDMKPDENEKHTRNCRSAVFGANAALHVHQWLVFIPYAPGGRSADPFTYPRILGYSVPQASFVFQVRVDGY